MDVVYFMENADSETVKIGFSSGPLRRIMNHEKYGYQLRAIIPASSEDEKRVLQYFALHRKSENYSHEIFHAHEDIYLYLDKLLQLNLAATSIDDAKALPSVPYSLWGPENVRTAARIDAYGQQTLFDVVSPKERIRYHSKTAYLSSVSDEWYTPESIIRLVKQVMGDIDLDPATSRQVNGRWIQAKYFYTRETNGLAADRPWFGRVWLNPPYGRGDNSAAQFAARLASEIQTGSVKEVITCLNVNSMTSKWFGRYIFGACATHCLYKGRINFIGPKGEEGDSTPSKGSVLSYYGPNEKEFKGVFSVVGQIVVNGPEIVGGIEKRNKLLGCGP